MVVKIFYRILVLRVRGSSPVTSRAWARLSGHVPTTASKKKKLQALASFRLVYFLFSIEVRNLKFGQH